jgi:hypothetical protein
MRSVAVQSWRHTKIVQEVFLAIPRLRLLRELRLPSSDSDDHKATLGGTLRRHLLEDTHLNPNHRARSGPPGGLWNRIRFDTAIMLLGSCVME